MEKRKKNQIKRMMTENQPNSIFKKLEITSISKIFELYLFFDLTQELVNAITYQSSIFLHQVKGIDAYLLEDNFNMTFNYKSSGTYIAVKGLNLLSSLWIIGVYPENPEQLVNKLVYNDGEFTYRFYTKNKNLVITKNKKNERKSTNYSRNLEISKRSQ